MKTLRLVLIVLITSLLVPAGMARTCFDGLDFKQFSTPEGLPNSMVHQVYQDRDGIYLDFHFSMDYFAMMVMRSALLNRIFILQGFWLITMSFA